MLNNFVSYLEIYLGNKYYLFALLSSTFVFKSFLLIYLIQRIISSHKTVHRSVWFLCGIFIGSLVVDSAWLAKLLCNLFIPSLNPELWIYTSWTFPLLQYQSTALFLESFIESHYKTTPRRFILVSITGLASCITFYAAVTTWYTGVFGPLMAKLQLFCVLYCLFLVIFSVLYVYRKLKTKPLPLLLKKQFSIIIRVFILPQLFLDFIQAYPFNFFIPSYITSSYAAVGLSNLIIAYALYYCSRRVTGLRFLNFSDHVQTAARFGFVDNFKDVLEQLSLVTNPKEVAHITQTFFKENFNIPFNRTTLYIRNKYNAQGEQLFAVNKTETIIETFIATHANAIELLKTYEILITDELEFSNFYDKDEQQTLVLNFLNALNADVFIPMYKNNNIIAYIVIDRHARTNNFYSKVERDEMLVFANYVGNVIYLLQNRKLETLLEHEKELKDELFGKHQEINQYKESMRSFLRANKQKEIGILFYKNRRFTSGNQTAQELVKINLNTHEGHPLTKAIKHVATQVEEYKSPQSTIALDTDGNKLVISGVPNLEKNNVIITLYHPDISDIVKRQLDLLKDPTKWDYLLYLETTKSGQLINRLIPGSGEILLNFKIELLKLALSKKAILLEMPTEDLVPTVEIIHHISLRETLHILTLQSSARNFENAIKLFGINPIFGTAQTQKPLLEKLDNNATLFIENIHLLEMEAQEYLAEYLKYGIFRVFKSDQKISSSVRIVCSSSQNLQARVHDGTFSGALFNELKKTNLVMPSLLTLPQEELEILAAGFSHLALQKEPLGSLFELTDKEKTKIALARPISLQELKTKTQQLLIAKSKKNEIEHETQLHNEYQGSSPELIQAARLGKHALRDQRTMIMLWDKFKNQNKIASFLGVNRSSVNRRCKEFNLQ